MIARSFMIFALVASTVKGQENIALGKEAIQDSVYDNRDGHLAVDGVTATAYVDGVHPCTHTEKTLNPWWSVNLIDTYEIGSVVLYNREDYEPERLHDVIIFVTDTPPSTDSPPDPIAAGSAVCNFYGGPGGAGERIVIECDPGAAGQYLVVQIADTSPEYLTLCEVEVYESDASAAGSDCTFLEDELAASQEEVANLQQQLAALLIGPVMPTAAPTATLSETAYEFTLDHNGIGYILETTAMHIALDSDNFCESFGMKLAQVENQETLDALSLQLSSIQSDNGLTLTEVATGERSSVNLDRDIAIDAFNAAGWNCATMVPDGDSFKMVGKKCDGERAVLCAAVPLYC